MSRYNTYNPIPSNAVRDFSDNAIIVDELLHKKAQVTPDRFGIPLLSWFGMQQQFREALTKIGYITMDSFQSGATLTLPNQVLRWLLPDGDGDYYRWDGVFPLNGKIVPPGSTPASTGGVKKGAWVSVGDAALRSMLASTEGTTLIGLPLEGIYGASLRDALYFLTPEMFMHDPTILTTAALQMCADAAKRLNLPVHASGNYPLTASVTFEGIKWRGGTLTATSKYISVSIIDSDVEGVEFSGPYALLTGGGNIRFHKNKLHGQTFTAALMIRDFDKDARIDCCYNEFWNCNYAILQQGTSTAMVLSGRYSFNSMHDIHGDGIELNVVQKHYPQGLVIEGNVMFNIDGTDAAWGIGIGIAGGGEYGIDAPDSEYVSNFIIRDNEITGCRQCIHVEKGRDFTISGNRCSPDTTKSSGSGLYFAAVAIYGCKRFTIDGVTGEPVGTANRFILIEWGVNGGTAYAGPPRDFTVRNVATLNGDIEISTAGADDWTNTTVLENCRCRVLKWRGLPPVSMFRDNYFQQLDCIGQHDFEEGSGGGIFNRSNYTFSSWTGNVGMDDTTTTIDISKMYCEQIDEANNNFIVPKSAEQTGGRGPVLVTSRVYKLPNDEIPGGTEYPEGAVFHKESGGYFLVTVGGAFISQEGAYADRIRATEVGQTFIQAVNRNWTSGSGAKSAGCWIVIPGAGFGGADLITQIVRGTYPKDSLWTVDINIPIQTATPSDVVIRAYHPMEYVEV